MSRPRSVDPQSDFPVYAAMHGKCAILVAGVSWASNSYAGGDNQTRSQTQVIEPRLRQPDACVSAQNNEDAIHAFPMLRIPPPTQTSISTWHTPTSPGFQDIANKKPEDSYTCSAEFHPNKIEVQSLTKAVPVEQQSNQIQVNDWPEEQPAILQSISRSPSPGIQSSGRSPSHAVQSSAKSPHQSGGSSPAPQSSGKSPQLSGHGSQASSPQRTNQPHGSPVINKPNQLFLDPSTARHKDPNKSPSHNKSPRSGSPGIMRKFQAVKSGLKMVHRMNE